MFWPKKAVEWFDIIPVSRENHYFHIPTEVNRLEEAERVRKAFRHNTGFMGNRR